MDLIETRADEFRGSEIQRRVRHRNDVPSRNQLVIGECVTVGVQPQFMGRQIAVAPQVEVGVVGHVDDGRPVGARRVVESQLVVIGQRIGHRRGHVAGITVFTVDAQVREFDRRFVLRNRERLGIPEHLRKSSIAPMNVVPAAVVDRDPILDFVDRESCVRDSICDPANDRSSGKSSEIRFERVGTVDHVDRVPVSVWSLDLRHDRAIRDDPYGHPISVAQSELLHRPSIWHAPEHGFFKSLIKNLGRGKTGEARCHKENKEMALHPLNSCCPRFVSSMGSGAASASSNASILSWIRSRATRKRTCGSPWFPPAGSGIGQ